MNAEDPVLDPLLAPHERLPAMAVPLVGKSVEVVPPTRYALELESTVTALATSPKFIKPPVPDPPRYVE